jgi:hypothetical protein
VTEDQDPTKFITFRLREGEWQAMFLSPDGSAEHRVMSPAELIELLELEALPEGSQRSQMAVIDRKHLKAHIAQRRIPPSQDRKMFGNKWSNRLNDKIVSPIIKGYQPHIYVLKCIMAKCQSMREWHDLITDIVCDCPRNCNEPSFGSCFKSICYEAADIGGHKRYNGRDSIDRNQTDYISISFGGKLDGNVTAKRMTYE